MSMPQPMTSGSLPSPEKSPSFATEFNLVHDADVLIENFLPPEESFVGGFKSQVPVVPHPEKEGEHFEIWPLPFCLPQLTNSPESTFARGYNFELNDKVGLSQDVILKFVDGLNLAITASPPLRIVDMAGMVIGFVPFHWAQIAAPIIQAGAQTAIHVLSKTLTDRYVRAANKRLFHPRGLTLRLCSTPAMMALITDTPVVQDPKWKKALHSTGRVAGTILLKAPIPFSSRIVRAIADPAPKLQPLSGPNPMGYNPNVLRRLQIPGEHALAINLDVPPPAKPEGVMDTMSSWAIKLDEWRAGRKANKAEQTRRIAARVEARSSGLDTSIYGVAPPGSREERREWKAQRRADRRARLIWRRGPQGGLLSGLIGPKETPIERRARNADLISKWSSQSVVWIVIMKRELDKEIEGIELADSHENEERVDDKVWKEVLAMEHEDEEDRYENEISKEETAANLGLSVQGH